MRVRIETKQFGPASRKSSRWAKTGTSGESPEVLFFKEGKVLCRKQLHRKSFQSNPIPSAAPAEKERPV